MKKSAWLIAIVCLGMFAQPIEPPAQAMDQQVLSKLLASRDALVAQLKEIQRNYDDVTRQIDDLRKKQDLLNSYRRETESAIAEVERAIANSH
jgi:septal ring factor EnvC (AmiA/AmiB activator)